VSPVKESIARDVLRILVWYPVRWLIVLLPPVMSIKLLRWIGDVHYYLSRKKRQVLLQNLRAICPHRLDHLQITRLWFRNYYIDRLLIFIFPKLSRHNLDQFLCFEGLGQVEEAIAAGRGVILLHGHFGPVHFPLVSLAHSGYRIMQVGNPSDAGLSWIGRHVAFRLRLRYEEKIPAPIVRAGGYLRPVFRCLEQHGLVMITGDGTGTSQHFGRQAVAPFLGRACMFPLGPYMLAAKTGAELIPLFILPEKDRYRVVLEAPLEPLQGMSDEMQHVELLYRFVERLSLRILENPECMHFLDRFLLLPWFLYGDNSDCGECTRGAEK